MNGDLSRVGRLVKAAQLLFCRMVLLPDGCSEVSSVWYRVRGGPWERSEVASISRTESKRNPVPWNPSSKTPLPKRAGSSINRSNARSFATGYRAVSLLPSLPRNLVSTKASSSLGRRPAVEDLQSQLDAARREIRHLHEQRDILKKRWAFSPNRPGTLRTGSRDEIRPFHRDALQQPRGFAQRAL